MKILLAGHFKHYIYEDALSASLTRIGHEVHTLKWFKPYKSILGRLEMGLTFFGPVSLIVSLKLVWDVFYLKPDIVIFFRPTLIPCTTLKLIKILSSCSLVSYNNDDPFSPAYSKLGLKGRRLWKIFRRSIYLYDVNWVYRPHNILDYENNGSKKTLLLPPYYLPEELPIHKPDSYLYEVVFIGHFTEERADIINFLIDNGIRVKVFGTNWPSTSLSFNYEYELPIQAVYGNEYYSTLARSKAALAFLSKLNRDVYTRRNFEIPAVGTCMISEWSEELLKFFQADSEAIFFKTKEDLLTKLKSTNLLEIGARGRQRAICSGYDIDARIKNIFRITYG